MSDTSRAINRIFTRKVLTDLIQHGSNEIYNYVVQSYIHNPEEKTNGEIISEIYNCLAHTYRSEYYYINTLLNKLVGKHSVNTTVALSQVKVGRHIADFVMINGEGRVYEIKTDLDNFDRLSDQLVDYFKAFSKVSVLVSDHKRNHVEELLTEMGDMGDAVGIYVLTENDTIFSKTNGREPKVYNENLEHQFIFTLLRKQEYENILMYYFNKIPQVAPVFYFKECLAWFSKIPILEAQDLAFKQLKKRNSVTKSVFESIPKELKSAVYFSNLIKKPDKINQFLKELYRRS